jgi:hypothetical protein
MKKLITTVCALALTFSVANAQDNTPKSGDWSVGTSADPILNYVGNLISGTAEAPGVNFTDGMSISGKLFTDDMTAWRASADLYFTSDSNSTNPFRLGLSARTTYCACTLINNSINSFFIAREIKKD